MRVECGSCKRLGEGQFQLAAGGGVSVTCTSCGAKSAAELHEAAAPATTIPLEKLCPKCGVTRDPEAAACRGCGISTARMAGFTAERDAAVPDDVRAEWDTLVGAWNDPARHDAFLLSVSRSNRFAWAAGATATRRCLRPHDPVAPRQLDRLRRAGEATLFASASARPGKHPRPTSP